MKLSSVFENLVLTRAAEAAPPARYEQRQETFRLFFILAFGHRIGQAFSHLDPLLKGTR